MDNEEMKKELLEIIKVVEFHVENIINILKLRIKRERERVNLLGIKKYLIIKNCYLS